VIAETVTFIVPVLLKGSASVIVVVPPALPFTQKYAAPVLSVVTVVEPENDVGAAGTGLGMGPAPPAATGATLAPLLVMVITVFGLAEMEIATPSPNPMVAV